MSFRLQINNEATVIQRHEEENNPPTHSFCLWCWCHTSGSASFTKHVEISNKLTKKQTERRAACLSPADQMVHSAFRWVIRCSEIMWLLWFQPIKHRINRFKVAGISIFLQYLWIDWIWKRYCVLYNILSYKLCLKCREMCYCVCNIVLYNVIYNTFILRCCVISCDI